MILHTLRLGLCAPCIFVLKDRALMCIETINLSAPRTSQWPIYSQTE